MGVQDALHRFGGMYGSAYRGPVQLASVVEVNAAVEINRIEVPLVGQTKQGYKPGRESREGTLRIHKIDSSWELEVYQFLSQGLATRRANRGGGALRQFQLRIEINDPDTYEMESWMLDGCMIWRMPLGFSITDDIIEREFPFTWENEQPINAFTVKDGAVTPYNPAQPAPVPAV